MRHVLSYPNVDSLLIAVRMAIAHVEATTCVHPISTFYPGKEEIEEILYGRR